MNVRHVVRGTVALALVFSGLLVGRFMRSPQDDSPSRGGIASTSNGDGSRVAPVARVLGASTGRGITVSEQPSIREQVASIVAQEVVAITSKAKLDEYLARLEQRAIEKGAVTALEVEPGIAAIRDREVELGPDRTGEEISKFSRKMQELSEALRDDSPPAPSNELTVHQIAAMPKGDARSAATREFVAAAELLAPEERNARLAQLDPHIEQDRAKTVDLASLAQEIAATSGDAKQAKIKLYLDASQALDPEARTRALERLDEAALSNP